MTRRSSYYTRVNVHTVKHDAVDTDMYSYLADVVSELKGIKTAHEMIIGTPDMIGYSIGKAIEYCERNMKEIEMRATGKLE